MSELSEIKPLERKRVIDLVEAAGIDVSDWGNFKGGKKKAAINPKYCYEWSFVEPKKVVVLNLWIESMHKRRGVIAQSLSLRDSASRYSRIPHKGVWAKRALKMDLALQAAAKDKLPIRVIVCDGRMRDRNDPKADASRVTARMLDPIPWAVTRYDWKTGNCTVTRGTTPDRFVDQFSLEEKAVAPERRNVSTQTFVRDPDVRRRVLMRANGKCEWCGTLGFTMHDGKIYLETHHVVPLGEGGQDSDGNVVALCPNHHREAHHGANRQTLRKRFIQRLRHLRPISRSTQTLGRKARDRELTKGQFPRLRH